MRYPCNRMIRAKVLLMPAEARLKKRKRKAVCLAANGRLRDVQNPDGACVARLTLTPPARPPGDAVSWCSQEEIERRIAEPAPLLRAIPTQEQVILMRRAELERLEEEARHELPSFTACFCCSVTLIALAVAVLVLFFVPAAHELPLYLYPLQRTGPRSTAAPTTPPFQLDTGATEDITALSGDGGGNEDIFSEKKETRNSSVSVVPSAVFKYSFSTSVSDIYDSM
ncbi:uncharacterized protein LOC144096904 [Amblyomma americanum]